MRWVLIALILAGCAAPQDPPAPPVVVPEALRSCPPPHAAPAAIGRWVTPERLRAAYAAERAARLADEAALRECLRVLFAVSH
jgi:hypothetical protein